MGVVAIKSGSIKLDGASVTGDLDIAKRAYHVSASLPTLFGLTADLIQVDGYRYTKISTSGDKYTKSEVSTPLLPSAAPSATLDVADTVNQLKSSLNAAGAQATLVGRDKVDGRDAYHVTVNVPVDKLNQQIGATGGSAASGISVDTASFDYWVYVDSLQPAKLDALVIASEFGSTGAEAILVFHALSAGKGTKPFRLALLPSDILEQLCAAATPVAHSITNASIVMRSAQKRLRLNRNRAVAMMILLDDSSLISFLRETRTCRL